MASSFVRGRQARHALPRRKASEQPQKKARREVRTTAENVISVEASPAPSRSSIPSAGPRRRSRNCDEILAFRDVGRAVFNRAGGARGRLSDAGAGGEELLAALQAKVFGALLPNSSCRRLMWTSWSSARRWTRALAAWRSGCGRWRRRSRTGAVARGA